MEFWNLNDQITISQKGRISEVSEGSMVSTKGPQFDGTSPREEGAGVNVLPGGNYRLAHLAHLRLGRSSVCSGDRTHTTLSLKL